MGLEDRCSRCGDVALYCDCPYTDPDWLGPQSQIFCVHCSAKAPGCECKPSERTRRGDYGVLKDEGFTRSGPAGYEPNTAYPESFYGDIWNEDEEHHR